MAESRTRDEMMIEEESQLNLGEFLASYLSAMEYSKANATAQVNQAYDNLAESTKAQKEGIKQQADETFRGIYSNAKATALGHNEQLAAMGLARGGNQAPSSGYSETSRIRQNTAMQNDLNAAAMQRDNNLAAVDTKISELNAQRANTLAGIEKDYGMQYLNVLQQTAQMEFDYYTWQQELDYRKEQDTQSQSNWQEQFDYQKTQDTQSQSNWQEQFDYQKTQDAQSQSNWQEQFDYQKTQDAQSQSNWEMEFAYQKQQDDQNYSKWLAEYLLDEEETETEAVREAAPIKVSEAQRKEAQSEERFLQYLRFAQSSASFPSDEAYASYFDQLYRQNSITDEQYFRALRARGYTDKVIQLRLGLM